MITDKQKEEIFLKIAPFELYYYDDIVMKHIHNGAVRSLSNDFENESIFAVAVNDLLKLNSVLFFNYVSKHILTKVDFIDYVSNQYNVFKENNEGAGLTEWLNHTKKLIFDRESYFYPKEVSIANKGAFMNWYNDFNKTLSGEVLPEISEKRIPVYQIALKYYYEDKHITEDNANSIANSFGYNSKTSGKGLLQDYQDWCTDSIRKSNPSAEDKNDLKLERKIRYFENVLESLPEGKKAKAFGDISILKSKLSDY